jgi:hypothetical protein
MADDRGNIIKELAGAATVQTQASNRAWITLITVALIAILPRSQALEIALPLGLGAVAAVSFHLVMFALLIVLLIAFAAAHAQQVRAQRLAISAIKALGNELILPLRIHPLDYFDMLRVPSVNRVAPLAQLFQGIDAFHGSENRPTLRRRQLSVAYYLALKTVSWLVYFGFPTIALWIAFSRMSLASWQWWLLLVTAVVGTLPILHVLIVDIKYVYKVSRVIGGAEHGEPPNKPLQPTSADGARL